MLAEKKRYEEEEKQKRMEQELEQELQRQAQLKLEGREEDQVSIKGSESRGLEVLDLGNSLSIEVRE